VQISSQPAAGLCASPAHRALDDAAVRGGSDSGVDSNKAVSIMHEFSTPPERRSPSRGSHSSADLLRLPTARAGRSCSQGPRTSTRRHRALRPLGLGGYSLAAACLQRAAPKKGPGHRILIPRKGPFKEDPDPEVMVSFARSASVAPPPGAAPKDENRSADSGSPVFEVRYKTLAIRGKVDEPPCGPAESSSEAREAAAGKGAGPGSIEDFFSLSLPRPPVGASLNG